MLGDCIEVLRVKHGLIVINTRDQYVGQYLKHTGTWCEHEVQLIAKFLRPGDTVVEVGSNIGAHTIAIAPMLGETGTLHAFEPQRIIFHHLAAAAALNGLTNVHCHRKGVGRSPGTAMVPPVDYQAQGNFGAVSLIPGREETEFALDRARKAEAVEVVTIDGMNLPALRLLKIDAEGMELDVIEGALETIGRHRPLIYTEWDHRADGPVTAFRLIELGYRVYPHCTPGNYNLVAIPKEWNTIIKGVPELHNENGEMIGILDGKVMRLEKPVAARQPAS